MATATDLDVLERQGSHYPTGPLVEHARVAVTNYAIHSAKLTEYGFPQDRCGELASRIAEVLTLLAARNETKKKAKGATEKESNASEKIMKIIRTVADSAPFAIRHTGNTEVKPDFFKPKVRLRSTERIVTHATEIRPFVQQLDDGFKPYFHGESATALLDSALAELQTADDSQEALRGSSPQATKALNIAKGRVLELLEELNHVAQLAFADDASISVLFDWGILERARKARRAKSESDSPSGPGEVPANPGDDGDDE